jgi:selenocysteine lyase/cysteine desulfurase
VPVSEPERVRAALDGKRIRAAVRGDGIRFSVHLWNDDDDIGRAVDTIRPFLQGTEADRE